MKVFILRGGSGSGKSTWAKKHGDVIVSTDNQFVDENDIYRFDIEKLSEAHAKTFRNFINLCTNPQSYPGEFRLVVDNTNTGIAELAPYAQVAAAYGHDVEILTFVYDPVAAFKRNIHGSPLDVCMRQHIRLMKECELIPKWWKHRFVLADDETCKHGDLKENA